jgi:hypothetical protein
MLRGAAKKESPGRPAKAACRYRLTGIIIPVRKVL